MGGGGEIVINTLALAALFGILGNGVSFLVFLSSMPMFWTIHKRKSSEGFTAIPYLVALFSASLLLYYGSLKTDALLIVTINAFGVAIELFYIMVFLFYATNKDRWFTIGILVVLNVVIFGAFVSLTWLFTEGEKRVKIVGWACASVNVAVFAAPLAVMRQVIRTRSVQFMPLGLSVSLTLCATTWFFYGLCVADYYIALPNVGGFLLGVAQLVLYWIYKDSKNDGEDDIEAKGGYIGDAHTAEMEMIGRSPRGGGGGGNAHNN
ncbi:hypothetical protein DM860_013304 [Cuscuta australis]|uniref:Bidirectional sugar transporter SWEET n=1 Tax=Cuscuta australis TaxID=267555 RepID=A0A328DSH9_9ASTE|nr:hypothetical protein DM860_013304 [Cuscuta australis]